MMLRLMRRDAHMLKSGHGQRMDGTVCPVGVSKTAVRRDH